MSNKRYPDGFKIEAVKQVVEYGHIFRNVTTIEMPPPRVELKCELRLFGVSIEPLASAYRPNKPVIT
ncbi:MAG TPA: hypothetical protein EYO59_00330 [Chromatiaceae bacterium]|jgi:transposase-like protein|nr:hypothetical protein [Chromatiaceae bacterium]